ncbi:hypothetical protein [Streptomyces sp. Ac-502]|uniref:hypothetical protein n=1 Tax=Streptomyces sp. Ac-502 TaxID=3342801 RepID=UPI003862ADA7
MADQKIGQLLDNLGVTADLEADDMPTDALVLIKAVQPDGGVAISIGKSETLDWVGQLGLLHGALTLISDNGVEGP